MYQVVDTESKKAVATGFSKREEAKVIRDERNGSPKPGKHIVSRGENHPHGASFGPVHQNRRWL